ncbi:MAG: amidohydrolase, partial [Firmicutes bacterium]|nr:amidohydrolase [Bacillota bacterium]
MYFEKLAPASPEALELRRELHTHPELSGKEERTSVRVAAWLEKLGLTVIRAQLPGRSLIGVLDTGKPGRTLALRADMDALPIDENPCNLKREKAFVSEVKGVAHMCGHDFHTAGLLETARRVAAMRSELKGKVVFCFESGEEMGLGDDVRALLAEQGGADAVFGIHVQADYPVGSAVILDGSCTAGCETFRIDVKGKSAHGATPHLGLDPLNCAAQIIVAANSIISRRINSREAAVITPCQIHGGSTWNRIPDDCFM